jgi:uncharacterized glyoxalase superfamily protein PhnB
MSASICSVVPVLPAADVAVSLAWWVEVCGFAESFRHGDPPEYVGITRDGVSVHLALVSGPELARSVGEQTMVRIVVADVAAMHAEYCERGGVVHPNGPLETKPWGTREFGAIDPNGVCVTFVSSL